MKYFFFLFGNFSSIECSERKLYSFHKILRKKLNFFIYNFVWKKAPVCSINCSERKYIIPFYKVYFHPKRNENVVNPILGFKVQSYCQGNTVQIGFETTIFTININCYTVSFNEGITKDFRRVRTIKMFDSRVGSPPRQIRPYALYCNSVLNFLLLTWLPSSHL